MKNPRKSISAARLAAAHALRMIETDPSSKATDNLTAFTCETGCNEADQRLARTLLFGVLRHSLTLDYFYEPFLNRSISRIHPVLRSLLRMAAYQKYYLSRIPDYAIVNETVEIAKSKFHLKPQQVGFLNAVLRKIAASDQPRALPSGNRVRDLAIRYSFSEFIAAMMVEKYGTHKTVAIMESCNIEPVFTVRVNGLQTDSTKLMSAMQAEGYDAKAGILAPEALIINAHPSGDSPFQSPLFNEGLFYVQDEASQLVAHVVAPRPGEFLLDMCAAPGGKTTHMAELSGGEARITAIDISENRLLRVTENIARLRTPGINIQTFNDAFANSRQYDAVLVDAPCSGLGTIRRNPEIRYRTTKETLARQQTRQLETLQQAMPCVRPGGRLIYSTCSFSSIENTGTITKFLTANPDWKIDTTATVDLPEDLQRSDGFHATWPNYPDLDGFEAVILRAP